MLRWQTAPCLNQTGCRDHGDLSANGKLEATNQKPQSFLLLDQTLRLRDNSATLLLASVHVVIITYSTSSFILFISHTLTNNIMSLIDHQLQEQAFLEVFHFSVRCKHIGCLISRPTCLLPYALYKYLYPRGHANMHICLFLNDVWPTVTWDRQWINVCGKVPFWLKGIKGTVHFEMNFWYVFAYLKGIQDVGVFVSTVFSILTFFGQTVVVCRHLMQV